MTVNEPVLLVAFNRPDLLRGLIDELREVKPKSIYLAVDGPRADRPGEADRVQACRDLAKEIDWTTDVHTNFQSTNLGCGPGVTAAVNWFFDNVERGIILEDDIRPDPSFYEYCTTMLDRYQDDERVFAITGCNVVDDPSKLNQQDLYRFSQYMHVWGWAGWRRTWQQHELDARGWWHKISPWRFANACSFSPSAILYWAANLELTARGYVNTWDWQLSFAAMRSKQLVVVPNGNLVSNVGFGVDATHTHVDESGLPVQGSMPREIPVVKMKRNRAADYWELRHHYRATVIGGLDRFRVYFRDRKGQ